MAPSGSTPLGPSGVAEIAQEFARIQGVAHGKMRTHILSGTGHVTALRLSDASGRNLLAKVALDRHSDCLVSEWDGLKALAATGTVQLPELLACQAHAGHVVMLTQWLEAGGGGPEWSRFGYELAELHAAPVVAARRAGTEQGPMCYGYVRDNWLGAAPQRNSGWDDWIEFNRDARLGEQRNRAQKAGLLSVPELRALDELIDGLDRWLPSNPRPSLLHGDLWSGNLVATGEGRVALIDPAVSIGDGWADIAMMQLFGGISRACLDAYTESQPDREGVSERIAIYKLYHLLNHLNIFGRAYASQVTGVLRGLGVGR